MGARGDPERGTCPNRIGRRSHPEMRRVFSNLDFALLREPSKSRKYIK